MQNQTKINFPFTAITGQDDFKLCLLLNLIDPTIGGVLANGDKGTGKTTTARALADLMGNARFVNLPIGATEDRVLGSIDLETLLKEKKTLVKKGLLTLAHKGILYVDEVNLLPDELVDILLDAAAFKGYALEREGISAWQESAFCLVGTMNPEEGDVRPQLKDRFGLSVNINTPQNLQTRIKIARNRLLFENNSDAFFQSQQEKLETLRKKITIAQKMYPEIFVSDAIFEAVAKICTSANVVGLRADIVLLKAAKAYTAFLGGSEITQKHLEKIAPFVLNHRTQTPPKKPPEKQNAPLKKNEPEKQNGNESIENTGGKMFALPETVKRQLTFERKKKR